MRPWLIPESRYLLWGKTGCGTSALMLAIGHACAGGTDLGIWNAPRPVKVIYLDGEMSVLDLQDRVREFRKSEAFAPHLTDIDKNMLFLNVEDFPQFAPLDKPECLEDFVKVVKDFGAELVILDNIHSLLSHVIKSSRTCARLRPIMTAIPAAQLWGHHAGLSGKTPYGGSQISFGMSGSLKIEGDKLDNGGFLVKCTVAKPFQRMRGTVQIEQDLVFNGSVVQLATEENAGNYNENPLYAFVEANVEKAPGESVQLKDLRARWDIWHIAAEYDDIAPKTFTKNIQAMIGYSKPVGSGKDQKRAIPNHRLKP